MWAHEIIILLNALYPDNEVINFMLDRCLRTLAIIRHGSGWTD